MRKEISFELLEDLLPDPKPNALEKIIQKENHIEIIQKALKCDVKGLNMVLLKQFYSTEEVAKIHQRCVSTINNHIRKIKKELG